jgi:hypothetical protein
LGPTISPGAAEGLLGLEATDSASILIGTKISSPSSTELGDFFHPILLSAGLFVHRDHSEVEVDPER